MRVSLTARSLAVATMLALGTVTPSALIAQPESVAASAVSNYFVYFTEPGAAKYEGGVAGLNRTASDRAGEKFKADRSEVASYRSHLKQLQDERIAQFEGVLGRALVVDYRYDILDNAITVRMTAEEAAQLAAQPNVRNVAIVGNYELATDRGPQFIGADQIWNGTATPGGNSYRGQGQVIGVLDTGVNLGHPSFANDAACGFSASFPKLIAGKDCIGSATCTGANPVDTNGHGSHTASTAGGNQHVATGGALAGTQIAGVAPCAQLITYKVCATDTCDGAAIAAGIQTAIVDGVDVLNFSISGGQNPWTDNDRGFLDLVNNGTLVAASAGNTNATITNPIGQVNHRGPWVLTVANSTHDRINNNSISIAGGPQNLYSLKSDAAFTSNVVGQIADAATAGNVEGCTATGGLAAGSMTGRIALIRRGNCTFEEKINNAVAAGAIATIIYNNTPAPPIPMGLGTATARPSVMTSQANGQAISTFIASNATAQATISSTTVVGIDPTVGDNLNSGSLRGPIAGGIEVTKPDITGPGTNIFAAYQGAANSYEFLSGTSMSSPHLAGSAALVKGLRPNWTVTEIKSAMQLTAKKEGLKDYTNGTPNSGQWDADDVGNGRIDMAKAARSGLVLNETYANFLAASGNQAAQRALNLPSMRNTACTPSCTWTRTVRNTLPGASTWNVSAAAISSGMNVTVSPSTFSFTGAGIGAADTIFANGFDAPVAPETRVITITATPTSNMTAIGFGEVNFTEATNRSPALRMTAAIRGNAGGGPAAITVTPTALSATGTVGGSAVATNLSIANTGGSPLTWSQGSGSPGATAFWDVPQNGTSGIVSSYSTSQAGGAYTAADFVITGNTSLSEIFTPGFDNVGQVSAQSQITWAIYPDASGSPSGNPENAPGTAVWTYSAAPTAAGITTTGNNIRLNLVAAGQTVNLTPGTYWLTVFPTYAGSITATGAARWNWFQAAPIRVTGSKLISPSASLFNVPTWTLTGTGGLGTVIEEAAMTLTGTVAGATCGASWLSMTPTTSTVAAGASTSVSVSMNPTGLTAGTHTANLCIDSNDTARPRVVVPVTFTVQPGGGGSNIVVVNNVNFSIPADGTGGAINWLTGATCACDTSPYMFNGWATGGNLAFFFPVSTPANTHGGVAVGSVYSVLTSGASIGPSSTFSASAAATAAANWRQAANVNGYFGFRFQNTTTGQVNYGYARMQTTGTTGFPATIVSYAYDNSGAAITIP
ncbi:S8 family serine peptidase [Dokdonella sp. MW10]|uniref:S8 family serine peptidase n=1 Tax=Dokdonella sp. MW10 TaxID=2992926 RepID=UPI003F7EF382